MLFRNFCKMYFFYNMYQKFKEVVKKSYFQYGSHLPFFLGSAKQRDFLEWGPNLQNPPSFYIFNSRRQYCFFPFFSLKKKNLKTQLFFTTGRPMQIQLAADAAVLESAMPRSVGRGAPRGSYRNGVAPSNGYRPRGGSRGGKRLQYIFCYF